MIVNDGDSIKLLWKYVVDYQWKNGEKKLEEESEQMQEEK